MLSVDGIWADWQNWGACSATCDLGLETRLRTCTNPAPQYGGLDCPSTTNDTETRTCDSGVMCGRKKNGLVNWPWAPKLVSSGCHWLNFEDPNTGYCFAHFEEPQNAYDAELMCHKVGGSLASFRTTAEITDAMSRTRI